MTHTATIEDLHRAIDQLIVRQRMRLWREGTRPHRETHTLPSLWEQLEAATGYQGTGTGTGSGGRERMPISGDVVELIIEISTAVSEAVMEHAGETRRTVPGNLRLLASRLQQHTDPDDLIEWWADAVQRWVSKARVALRLNPARPRWARGVTCPECHADSVSVQQDGETVRRPALSIQWTGPSGDDYTSDDEWKVRAVVCDACGTSWWRGPDLDALVTSMMRSSREHETLIG